MITSLLTSLMRVTLFWYIVFILVLFIGDPPWAEALYQRLMVYPWVPVLEMHGLGTAAAVQWRLLIYWTVPLLILWLSSIALGALVAEARCLLRQREQQANLKPTGQFWGVNVPGFSIGALPRATTPELTGAPVSLGPTGSPSTSAKVELQGAMREAVKMLTPAERQLAEELLQLLLQAPNHYAGLGHGVGLLEHTLNVVTEAAGKVTPEFRMPLLAALSHDIGKLITFQPDGKGGWKRRGLHSRESARILATLPAFQELPEVHQRALLLAIKYDHAPSKMPELRGERDAVTLAMRTISSLAHADRKATADEKERHLERLQPEDLLWKDFVDFLREAPVVQRGKKGVANQVNNPPDSPYLFLYEAPWRDAAVRRLPAEVAAALDLTRRDAGKMAKYTRILVERLRKEGLLVESYVSTDKDGATQEFQVSENNPLWDIQSGTGEKAVVLRGILVLHADNLWKKLNYRISIKSPFPVQILAPNADVNGKVNGTPSANRDEPRGPEVSDGLKLADIDSTDTLAALGLTTDAETPVAKPSKPKTRGRVGFRTDNEVATADDSVFGLARSDGGVVKAKASSGTAPAKSDGVTEKTDHAEQDESAQERAELEAALAGENSVEPTETAQGGDSTSSKALDSALAYMAMTAVSTEEPSNPAEEPVSGVTAEEPVLKPTTTAQATVKQAKRAKLANQMDSGTAATQTASTSEVTDSPRTEEPAGLSRAERREQLAIADELAVAKYPGLTVGDKYYTENSPAVQVGLKKPGSRYKGDKPDKTLGLTESGPRRGRRRLTS